MNIYSPKELTLFLEENGFFFKKNLGQNFLINENTAEKIALSSLTDNESHNKKLVIEIGPGAGNLTFKLSEIYDKVISIEIDKFAIKLLSETLKGKDNIEIINADALKFDYLSLKERFSDYDFYVCANLPYYITSEMIMTLLESGIDFISLTFLIQKEAAERFISLPKTPEYGAITVSASLLASSKKLFNVSPGNFIPKPKVDSSVIKFIPRKPDEIKLYDRAVFSKTVKSAFISRRKTLLNTLKNGFEGVLDKDSIISILQECNISPETRGEALSLEQFVLLSNIIYERSFSK